ncbi:MAG TPA: hypothetical protein VE057_12005 [Archangium sp.]|nr:hypothetical protein [Archangium sp.]
MQFVFSASVATVLGLSCATAPSALYGSPSMGLPPPRLTSLPVPPGAERNGFEGVPTAPPYRTPSSFEQSCGPACAAPVSSSTGEILAPAAARAAQVLEKTLQVTQAIQGFLTVAKFLDEAQKKRAEDIIVACVKEAHFKVEEDLFGKGKSLPGADCKKPPAVEKQLAPTWRRHLGILKHAAAFACIQERFSEEFPDNFSVEPRYRKDGLTQEVILTDRLAGSLHPDLVLHFTRNATRIQCIYEFKFPCGDEKNDPWSIAEVEKQMKNYAGLGGECKPALVTPQMGLDRR